MDSKAEKEIGNVISDDVSKNFMKYSEKDINKVLFEFQRSRDYEHFIAMALEIRDIASRAAGEFMKDRAADMVSGKLWEKIDKSEDIYEKKRNEETY